jgi:hypothetical protein
MTGATQNPTDILWCCHVRGPDDVHAAPDYATALKWCDSLTSRDRDMVDAGECVPLLPFLNAVPAVWPHSAESHATDLPKSIAYFSAPAEAFT